MNPPVHKAMRLDVSDDIACRSLVLVELLGNEHTQLHTWLLDEPQHAELGEEMLKKSIEEKFHKVEYWLDG